MFKLPNPTYLKPLLMCSALLLATVSAPVLALCGGPLNDNNYNEPVDYTNPDEHNRIRLVERYHFNANVEYLKSGMNGPLPGDIHYTLQHIPNHYRALNTMAAWERRQHRRQEIIPDWVSFWSADCYFERALTFKPRDPTLYLVWGIHLHNSGKLDQALDAYDKGKALREDYAELSYNRALLHIDRKEMEEAQKYAKLAYEAGYPLPGLRNKLAKLGAWPP